MPVHPTDEDRRNDDGRGEVGGKRIVSRVEGRERRDLTKSRFREK